MKKIQSFIIFIILIFTSISLSAQNDEYQEIKPQRKSFFLVRGGLNISELQVRGNGQIGKSDTKLGFNVGVTGDISLRETNDFYIRTGLLLSNKGWETFLGEDVRLTYLEVPIQLAYTIPFAQRFYFSISLGVYVAYGISGNYTPYTSSDPWGYDSSYFPSYLGTYDVFNRFDFGIGGEMILGMDRFALILGSSAGLTNCIKSQWALYDSPTNNCVSISLAYKF